MGATKPIRGSIWALLATALIGAAAACATVRVEAPEEPIEINLNVKVDGEVKLKLEEEANELIDEKPELFG
ncbi:MAG: YnbE family lipoprotein [Pseudomonadota bacterium]